MRTGLVPHMGSTVGPDVRVANEGAVPGVMRVRELDMYLNSLNTQDRGLCTSTGQKNRMGPDCKIYGELHLKS